MFTDTYVAYRFETWGPEISKILDNLKKPQQTTTTNKQQPPKIMKIIIRGGGGVYYAPVKKGGELIMINHFLDGG